MYLRLKTQISGTPEIAEFLGETIPNLSFEYVIDNSFEGLLKEHRDLIVTEKNGGRVLITMEDVDVHVIKYGKFPGIFKFLYYKCLPNVKTPDGRLQEWVITQMRRHFNTNEVKRLSAFRNSYKYQ